MMTLKNTLAVAGVCLLAATGLAQAETARPYITLGAGLTMLEDTNFSGGGTSVDVDANDGIAFMGAFGMGVFNNFRAELELAHRKNGTDPNGEIAASTLMGNLLFDMPFRLAGFQPYIGGGLGYGRFGADNIPVGGAVGTVDDSDWTFAYQGIAGVAAPITNNLSVSLDYRYMSTFNEPEYGTSTGLKVGGEYSNHTVMVGLRWSFGGAPAAPAPMAQPAAAPKPATPPAPVAAAAPMVRSFQVFFDFDRSDITDDARKIITQAADNVRKAGGTTRITLTGHADRSGPAQYNMRLSQRRADAVKAELVKLGVSANEIATVAKGESDPLVPTADGVREPRNRRVEIVF
jgi:outer membrane protein OmpA-like peptidoglycan-associated protein